MITIRLSAISLAGTARTDVAVGTSSEAFMFFTTVAAAPRSGVVVPSSTAGAGRAAFAALPAAGFSGAGRCRRGGGRGLRAGRAGPAACLRPGRPPACDSSAARLAAGVRGDAAAAVPAPRAVPLPAAHDRAPGR